MFRKIVGLILKLFEHGIMMLSITVIVFFIPTAIQSNCHNVQTFIYMKF